MVDHLLEHDEERNVVDVQLTGDDIHASVEMSPEEASRLSLDLWGELWETVEFDQQILAIYEDLRDHRAIAREEEEKADHDWGEGEEHGKATAYNNALEIIERHTGVEIPE